MAVAPPPLLAARTVTKRFGRLVALADADLELIAGEVHAVVGENGAGKSTLAKVLAGVHRQDAGEVLVDGRSTVLRNRRAAIAAGIGFVPQQLSLVGALSLVENHLLAQPAVRLDEGLARRQLTAACERLDVAVPFDVPTMALPLAQRQLGELAVAVAQGARVLLLDEPTSTLGPVEIARLVECVRHLAATGTAVALVTHRITEVLDGADRVTVLRAGRVVHCGPTAGLHADELAQLMVGERSREVVRHDRIPGPVRLVAEGVVVREDGQTVLDGVSLSVAGGEVVGVAGVAGAAQPALSAVLAGVARPDAGRVAVDGTDVTGRGHAAAAAGVAHVPDDRSSALVAERPVSENASLLHLGERDFHRFGLRRRDRERALAASVCAAFHVHPPRPELAAGGLSGGNQQKLVVGRELERHPAVVVAHGPTQGLDLAATATIRSELLAAAADGAAVVVISADLDEVLELADRVLVLAGGRITAEFDQRAGPVDLARLGRAMAGDTGPDPTAEEAR